ncbi:MAG TPA: methionine--tRNA ligase [Bacillota bacterium]|nr:methionine--tRNA ligase [Bacillota bacterium]
MSVFSLTVAIDYSNGDPHIGHAYEKVAADALARYRRLQGDQVSYVMGTDEHSLNVARAAREQGLTPQAYCDKMAAVFRGTWDAMGISYSSFFQTSDPRHVRAVQDLVSRIHDAGHVFSGTYRGWYCPSCEAFYTEKDLVDGSCPIHKRPAVEIEEENYFFRLSAFRDRLLAHLREHPEFIRPDSRRHEIENVLAEGLEDVSISRGNIDWGVPLPWDPKQVVYVWFDALITYLSAIGYGWDQESFARFWPADVHFIGKDITRFHCIIWPAMLMAAGLPLPRTVFGHGFLSVNGEKLSKSTGNIIDPIAFQRRYGRDATRYYLLAETPFGQDGNIAAESFVKRYNSDLANDLGNLVSRTTALVDRHFQGRVPEPGERDQLDQVAAESVSAAAEAMDDLRIHDATAALWRLVNRANKYVDETAPWRADVTSARRSEVLYNLCEVIRILAIALQPFLVDAPKEIWTQLGGDPAELANSHWGDTRWGGLRAGQQIHRGAPLFQRLDADEVISKAEGFRVTTTQSEEPGAHTISIEEFRKVDLRLAEVLSAEKVKGADRLLKLRLRVGTSEREIVSSIAQHYQPEELVGKQIVVVANLEPATIRGVRSEGMLLAASTSDGQLALVVPEKNLPSGIQVK